MTEYLFPPDRPHVSAAVGNAAPALMLGMLLMAVGMLIWRSRRPAAWIDLAGWVLIGAAAIALWRHVALTDFGGNGIALAMFLTNIVAILAGVQLAFRKWGGISAGDALSRSAGVLVIPLILMLLPSTACVIRIETARLYQCQNNLRELAIAIHDFHDRYARVPAAVVQEGDKPPRSWRVELLPFFDETDLRERYVDAQPWDSFANAPLLPRRPQIYLCPSTPKTVTAASPAIASYAMPMGPHAFDQGRQKSFQDVTDGRSNTIMLVEACGRNLIWLEPRDVEVGADVSQQELGINQPGYRPGYSRSVVSSYHHEAAHVALGDGSVRRLNEQIDPQLLRALLTVDGLEPIPDWYQPR